MLVLDKLFLGGRPSAGITHTFEAGKIAVVLGRNGSGKSRLCRVLAGLEPVLSGRMLINGVDVGQIPVRERSVALVHQSFVNYPNLTVAQNIASPLTAKHGKRGLSKSEIRAEVEDLATRLQIQDLLMRKPGELSGGQQQRLAIARALARKADVLLLDEPLVNLDYNLREDFEVELRDLLTEQSAVVIYTSSDPADAFGLGDEVLLLHEHNLLQAGTADAIYAEPVSLIAADLMSDPGVNELQVDGHHYVVRPEQLQLAAVSDSDKAFDAVVEALETNGSDTFLRCSVSGKRWIAKLTGLVELAIGERVKLYVHPDDLLSFG